jgi:hypothetical protein
VRASVEAYKKIFKDLAGHEVRSVLGGSPDLKPAQWETVLKMAKPFDEKLRANHPDLVEEMEGVAKGAEVEYMSILSLNVRSE